MTMIVCIDPGHGGRDFGTHDDGFRESEVAFSVAKRLERELLDAYQITGITRSEGEDPSLKSRQAFASEIGAHLFISLHVNSTKDPSTDGTMCFLRKGSDVSERVAKAILSMSPLKHGNPFWYTNEADIKKSWLSRANNCLKDLQCPGLLVEMGFRSNTGDRKYLQSDDGRQAMAQIICNAVMEVV